MTAKPNASEEDMARAATQACSKCGATKPLSEFYAASGKPYRMRKCKRCHAGVVVAWRKQNPEKARAIEQRHAMKKRLTRIEREYGITPDILAAMHVSQAGRCAICSTDSPLDVDHDHTTGAVRGLLCRNCNRALGWLQDSPGLLVKAALYLQSAKGTPWPKRG